MNSHEAIRGFFTFVLLIGIFTTAYIGFSLSQSSLYTLASIDKNKPESISVHDISTNSAVISWQTQNPTAGKILMGKDPVLCNGIADERNCKEVSDDIIPKSKHNILLTNLSPQTTYYVYIKIGKDILYPPSKPLNFRTF